MIREGLYEDPTIEAVALSFHAIRCVRAIIDEGLHTGAMNEAEAIALYEREAGLGRAHAEREILRSKRIPTQLATYFFTISRGGNTRSAAPDTTGEGSRPSA